MRVWNMLGASSRPAGLEALRSSRRRGGSTPASTGRLVLLVVLATVAACGGPIPVGVCNAPRAALATPYHGKLKTKVDGLEVEEQATVRFVGAETMLEVSIAPDGGSESTCLLHGASTKLGGICQDPGDSSGKTVVKVEGGRLMVARQEHVDLEAQGTVLGLPGKETTGLHVEWSFSGDKAVIPPERLGVEPVLRMNVGPHAEKDGFLDNPFPSVLRVKGVSNGVEQIDLTGFPDAVPAPMPFPSLMKHIVFAAARDILATLRAMAAARGFSVTSGVFFQAKSPLAAVDSTKVHTTLDAPFVLVPILPSGVLGAPHPVRAHFREQGGSLALPDTLVVMPVQGRPLLEDTLYLALVRTGLSMKDGGGLGRAAAMDVLQGALAGAPASGLAPEYLKALRALAAGHGPGLDSIAALTVFRTGRPTAGLLELKKSASEKMTLGAPFQPREVRAEMCVYESKVRVPVYQRGTPPYQLGDGILPPALDFLARLFGIGTRGGEIVVGSKPQQYMESRVVLTVPRRAQRPAKGWPLAVFVRAGAGLESDQSPLVDRGATLANGGQGKECLAAPGQTALRTPIHSDCGAGPGLELARAGFVGVSVDGPQTGSRLQAGNSLLGSAVAECAIPAYSGEDVAMFDVCNPRALMDNIRESAFEAALVPDLMLTGPIQVEPANDPCNLLGARFDAGRVALMGHSMGATIAPLAAAIEPRFRAIVLSGGNGSYIENLVAKQRPDAIAPGLEELLNLQSCTTEFDVLPHLFQWAAEPSDPAVYGPLITSVNSKKATPPDVLMIQGIGDHYVPSPIANVNSLALQLDLVGAELDAAGEPACTNPKDVVPPYTCSDKRSLRYPLSRVTPLLELVGRGAIPIPPTGLAKNRLGATGALVQYRRDQICRDDGHEVIYNIGQARWQYRCFLRSFATTGSARVFAPPARGDDDTVDITTPCPGGPR